MSLWEEWLAAERARREELGLQRKLHARGPSDDVVDLAGNDYLSLTRNDEVTTAAADAARTWGAGAGASRLVTGTTGLHAELESELAEFMGQPAAVVMSTGYHANLAVVTALADRTSLIVSDAHVHASLIDAARLSRAEIAVVPHNDVSAVAEKVAGARSADGSRRILLLVESIYSVLGDASPLSPLSDIAATYEAMLVVDEAHGLGVMGSGGHGVVRELMLEGHPSLAVTATLSKALGSQGGAVLGSPALVDHLVNRARPFIFDTGLAPAAAAGALAALRHLRRHPELPEVIGERVSALAARIGVPVSDGAVLSIPMATPQVALAAQAACLAEGVRVGCFRPPSVPDGISRLRITTNAGIPDADWARATEVVERVVKELT